MLIPETPLTVSDLDIMKRLKAYAEGQGSWYPDNRTLGVGQRRACSALHANLLDLVDAIAPLLDRVNAREMATFTMHDTRHAQKVAHLMWHILKPERREQLTPPEIGLLVGAAYLHDLGMFLSDEDRARRLLPESDLWTQLEATREGKREFDELRKQCQQEPVSARQQRVARQLVQAEEALLCQDSRKHHAAKERYDEILASLQRTHEKDRPRIPDVERCLTFEGDTFRDKLVDICVSHNESAEMLVRHDPKHWDRPRFPTDYPLGCTTADLHLVAAALRLADILDFDRERTPSILYHYLLPGVLNTTDDRSTLEWSKHLSIANWEMGADTISFRGRCRDHIVHHAIVQFCDAIAEEIAATRATFGIYGTNSWAFALPPVVRASI